MWYGNGMMLVIILHHFSIAFFYLKLDRKRNGGGYFAINGILFMEASLL